MAILADDLQFYQSERLTDANDAGGFATDNEVFDNVDNNLFPDIASGDRISGRAQLRKCFAAVRSPDDDTLMNSRVYVASPPVDTDVNISLIIADSQSEELAAAKTALENSERSVYGIMTLATEAAASSISVIVDNVNVPVCPAFMSEIPIISRLDTLGDIPVHTGWARLQSDGATVSSYITPSSSPFSNADTDTIKVRYRSLDDTLYSTVSSAPGYFSGDFDGKISLIGSNFWLAGQCDHAARPYDYILVSFNLLVNTAWTGEYHYMILTSPVSPGSITVTANAADNNAAITSSDNGDGRFDVNLHADSFVNYETGFLALRFAEAVKPETLSVSYNSSAAVPIDPEVIGLNPTKFPNQGRRAGVRVGDFVIVQHLDSESLTNPVGAGATYTLARSGVQSIWLEDATGTRIAAEKYTTNLTAGSVTMANPLDLSGYTQPLVAYTALQDVAMAVSVSANTIILNRALTNTYPADESTLSAMIRAGDLGASLSLQIFAQQAWTSVWSDSLIGNGITPQYNDIVYPITVTNDGAITERWRIQFTGNTTVNIIGETVGQITQSTLSITETIAPTNPFTGNPYFTISADGWGAGWVSGNLIRFNTSGAELPIWVIRCVQSSNPPVPGTTDRIRLAFIGDVDA